MEETSDKQPADAPFPAMSIEELEEELGLQSTTLESLTAKLQRLNEDIVKEEQTSSTLRDELQQLDQRKAFFRKRTDKNLKLVKDLEISLEKCLERLRTALDALKGKESSAGTSNLDPGDSDDDSTSGDDGAESSDLSKDGNDAGEAGKKVAARNDDDHANNTGSPSQIDVQFHQSQTTFDWPTKLIQKEREERNSEPVDLPLWRIEGCAKTLIQCSSVHLIVDVMNSTVLEHRYELEGRDDLSKDCGWLKQSNLWGTCLDVYSQIPSSLLHSGFRRTCQDGHGTMEKDEMAGVLNPNVILCPYELNGTCADEKCPYQHLKDNNRRKRKRAVAIESTRDEETGAIFVQYDSLPELKLPRPFDENDFVCENTLVDQVQQEEAREIDSSLHRKQSGTSSPDRVDCDANRFYCSPFNHDSVTLAELKTQLDEAEPHTMEVDGHQVTVKYSFAPEKSDFEQNFDIVNLPAVEEVNDGQQQAMKSRYTGFSQLFWWQQHIISSISEDQPGKTTFDRIVSLFNVVRNEQTFRILSQYTGEETSSERQSGDILLCARIVDLTRMCLHMGKTAVGAQVCSTDIIKSINIDWCRDIVHHTMRIGQTPLPSLHQEFCGQTKLLTLSTALQADFNVGLDDDERVAVLSLADGDARSSMPVDVLEQKIRQKLLASVHINKDLSENGWSRFMSLMKVYMDKCVMAPFKTLTCCDKSHLSFLMQCIDFGCSLVEILTTAWHQPTCNALLHILEPAWEASQYLRSTKNGCVYSVLMFGPLLFGSVSSLIARPHCRGAGTKKPRLAAFDSRTYADLSCLSKFILGMLKDLSTHDNLDDMAFLTSPLYSLCAAIYCAQGEWHKSQIRLENVVGKTVGSGHPSLFALSQRLWCQVVQLRLLCPPPESLRKKGTAVSRIAETQKTASVIIGNGVDLQDIKLPGDALVAPSLVSQQNVRHLQSTVRQLNSTQQTNGILRLDFTEETHQELAAFPQTFMLLKSLTHLALPACGLRQLPLSLGCQLNCLKFLHLRHNLLCELPSSIGLLTSLVNVDLSYNRFKTFPESIIKCEHLQVMDFSYNQLESFPADLALRCRELTSLKFDGNPAGAPAGAL